MDQSYKFVIEERVRWATWTRRALFSTARTYAFRVCRNGTFRAVGLSYGVMFDELDVWLPRAHLECDFHHAAQLDDLLEVSVYVGRVGTKSLRFNFEVRRKGEELMIAEAHFVLVTVRRETFETVPVPEELKRRLAPYTKPSSKKTSQAIAVRAKKLRRFHIRTHTEFRKLHKTMTDDSSMEFDMYEEVRRRLAETFEREGHAPLRAEKIALYVVQGIRKCRSS
jgi:acyl-CoA thioesterase FadM